jgi:hypothetical protein
MSIGRQMETKEYLTRKFLAMHNWIQKYQKIKIKYCSSRHVARYDRETSNYKRAVAK